MCEIDIKELVLWQEEGRNFLLVDVREPYEHEALNIGGKLIPLGELMSRRNELDKDIPIVLYCEKGIRSTIALQRLEGSGFHLLYNLKGGMKAVKNINNQCEPKSGL